MSLLMRDGRIAYLGPSDGAPDATDADTVDASGATIVPGLVDCHAHFTGLGGANWLARFGDPEAELLSRGDDASRALARMGILTARDVGAPHRLNLRIRDRVRGRTDAGDEVTFTADELTPTVEAVHARGKRITAHAQGKGAAVAVAAGVDSVEHGFGVDATTAARMAGRTALVPTLGVLESFVGFASTDGGRFAESKAASEALREQAFAAVRAAKAAGVRIATGSDFGGGSVRPGHLAWEVEMLVRAGLEPHEALASATWIGGELLGLRDAGNLAVGGPADVVLVHGDPLADPAALWRVWRVYHRGARVG
ncbi:MAG: hypothetical protein E6I28_14570 [Chloroflexi bacterium]|nr:MAG: hypothetical protein E6I28_14570 [Chloroflexota bacterium]